MGLEGFHIHEVVLRLSGSGPDNWKLECRFWGWGKTGLPGEKHLYLHLSVFLIAANEWLVFIGFQVVYFFLLNTKTTFRLTRQDNVYLAPYNDMKYPNGSIPQI